MLKANTPYFWKKKFHLFTLVLLPFSLIYFFLIKLNKIKFFFQPKIKIKTICVGNINIGGTGKTPLVKKIYDELKINQKCCIPPLSDVEVRKIVNSIYRKHHRNG